MYHREMVAAIHLASVFGVTTSVLVLASTNADVPEPDLSMTVVDIWSAIFWANPEGVVFFFASAALFHLTNHVGHAQP